MEIDIRIDDERVLKKVSSDKFGTFVSQSWKRLLDPYTPFRTGNLIGAINTNVAIKPFAIEYNTIYAEYVYESEGWDFFKERSPFATDHWDEKAAQAGQLDKLYRTLNNGLQSGRF